MGNTDIRFPLRVAAIDIGSNAIRFLAVEFTSPLQFEILKQDRFTVRLGHGVFLHGRLEEGAMEAAVAALSSIKKLMAESGIDHYRCVATSAVRESANRDDFIQRVGDRTGIKITVINGSEEIRLIHAAVRRRVPLGSSQWIIADLGGGSLEVSLVDDNGILWSESHTMGSIRLLEELSVSSSEPGRFNRLLADYVSTLRIPSAAKDRKPSGFIATGGNIEELSRLAGASSSESTIGVISVASLKSIIDRLMGLSYRQRVEKLGLREDRADVILPAAMVYDKLASFIGVDTILVPHVGIKEGVLFDLIEELTMHRTHEKRQEEQLLSASINLGRRYFFEEAHALHVTALAVSLFDQLRDLHHLGERERLILLAASVLHDIGSYISLKKHHKHSLYLISQSELPGFSDHEILMTANVARYHRKGEPRRGHELFDALFKPEQSAVAAMASILRIADALDREHLQRVKSVIAEQEGGTVRLQLNGPGDFGLERWALQKKGLMFETLFSVKINAREAARN